MQEYPYFSHDLRLVAKQKSYEPKMSKNMFQTFDPATERALNEYIWIDYK